MQKPRDPEPLGLAAHDRLVERTRRALLRRSTPRLQMTFIVAATGLSGLGASVLLRRVGIDHMGVRYGLAVALAYGCFLLLLGLWLAWSRRGGGRVARHQPDPLDLADLADLPVPRPRASPAEPPPWMGAGGRMSGGGSSGDLHLVADAGPPPRPVAAPSGRGGGGSWLPDLGLDLDELVAVVLAVAAVTSAVLAAGWVIYEAPTLLADLLVDGALSAGLYRRLRRGGNGPWWSGAMRRTALPALAVLVFFAAAGVALQHVWPQARTMGDAWRLLGTGAR